MEYGLLCAAGVGMEGECVGEGEGDVAGEVHGGAEQTVSRGRRRPLHPHHQQRDGVGFPVHLQLHGLELVRPRHHDHLTGGDRCVVLIYHFKFHLTGTECGGFIRTPKLIFSLENAPN